MFILNSMFSNKNKINLFLKIESLQSNKSHFLTLIRQTSYVYSLQFIKFPKQKQQGFYFKFILKL